MRLHRCSLYLPSQRVLISCPVGRSGRDQAVVALCVLLTSAANGCKSAFVFAEVRHYATLSSDSHQEQTLRALNVCAGLRNEDLDLLIEQSKQQTPTEADVQLVKQHCLLLQHLFSTVVCLSCRVCPTGNRTCHSGCCGTV